VARHQLVFDEIPAVHRPLGPVRQLVDGRLAAHGLVEPHIAFVGPRRHSVRQAPGNLGTRAVPDVVDVALPEHRQLRRDDDERQVPLLAPRLVQRPMLEHVIELALAVAALAVAMQEQHDRPVLAHGVPGR
jgi:hypothetical protein